MSYRQDRPKQLWGVWAIQYKDFLLLVSKGEGGSIEPQITIHEDLEEAGRSKRRLERDGYLATLLLCDRPGDRGWESIGEEETCMYLSERAGFILGQEEQKKERESLDNG